MEVCEFALMRASLDAVRKKKNKMSARPRTIHRERPGHVSAIHLKHFIVVFSTQVIYVLYAEPEAEL